MLRNNRTITISAANSRRATYWPAQTLQWFELVDKLKTPTRSTEKYDDYLKMPKRQQDDLKDVGGFVAGTLTAGRRKRDAVVGRDVLTLDMDHIPAGKTDDVLRRVDGLGCAYCVYSTRKHAPHSPRLRVLLPFDRTVTADEYEPIARKAAEMIGIEMCDPTTFEAHRLMYWSSCCADSQYVYQYGDKPFLAADGILGLYTQAGQDWRDMTKWPTVPGAPDDHRTQATKQGDPTAKSGIVGAFCRAYDVPAAMDKFLAGVYVPVDGMDDRYTFAGGSTTGGALVYDGGKFLFSHHATDPAGGRLVNAFDLVRLHLYGDQDDTAQTGTPTVRLPSYDSMRKLASADEAVSALLDKEHHDKIMADFGINTGACLTFKIQRDDEGKAVKTIDNVWAILEQDPLLQGKFALNEFANRGEVFGSLPWNASNARRQWDDADIDGIYWYLEKEYKISANGKVDSALNLHGKHHAFNDVKTYLTQRVWDGVPRLDNLFIDYLGAEDTPYIRAVTRKAFVAAVARAMTPGSKFDCMTVISGPQGIGKSTLLRKMANGWFTDGLRSFEGKDASELIQGVWIVEIGELEAFRRADVSRIKQFLSQCTDRYRAAYARTVKELPRCCVFFGTTNDTEYLRDMTGNRRFWPVDAGIQPVTKSVFDDLDDELDQLWAEAYHYWMANEPLYLSGDIETAAMTEQEKHRETSTREGIIRDFLEREVPVDWDKSASVEMRRMYWGGGDKDPRPTAPRKYVCALEVWCEALGCDMRNIRYTDSREINDIIAKTPGWERLKSPHKFPIYGSQKGFIYKLP